MNAFQAVVAIFTAIIGLLTGIATLYAKYLDIQKARRDSEPPKSAKAEAPRPEPVAPASVPRFEDPFEPPPSFEPPPRSVSPDPASSAIDQARRAVKAPAIAMIFAGFVSISFWWVVAGYGFIDEFVITLDQEKKERRDLLEAAKKANIPIPARMSGTDFELSDRATTVLTIFATMSLSVASAAAIWAGIGMLRLRGYWVSVVGSYCIMCGAFACCFAGVPIGIWSLTVLMRPEVKASFR